MKTTKTILIIGILVFLLINLIPLFFYILLQILKHPGNTILFISFIGLVILLIIEVKKQIKFNNFK